MPPNFQTVHRGRFPSRATWELAAVAFAVLFQELALIRWLPMELLVAAYFPNLVLLGAFLGLGIGCLLARRGSLLWLWPVALFVLVMTTILLGQVAFTAEGSSEYLWLLYSTLPRNAPVFGDVRPPLVILFVLVTCSFVPAGQFVARRLEVFRRRSSALRGYAVDIAASLAGVGAFTVIAMTGSPPVIWFGILLGLLFPVFQRRERAARRLLAWGAGALVLVTVSSSADLYTPYYSIIRQEADSLPGFRVLTNGSQHQIAWSMQEGAPVHGERHRNHREGINYPSRIFESPPRRALVLGAGTGNDVAALLDWGVDSIDAVEIDPGILELGRDHPDEPYDSPHVQAINDDARSYVSTSDRQYDLILYGTLDSQTDLSAVSNIRLDNFVYTLEGLSAARDLLTPDGGLVLYFWTGRDFIHDHLVALLTEVFGEPPLVRRDNFGMLNAIYLTGPAFKEVDPAAHPGLFRPAITEGGEISAATVPTDDWPYLYLPDRDISEFYVSLLAVFGLLALIGVAAATPEISMSGLELRPGDLEMFCYGFGFLLLETRLVSQMHLLWGSTWLSSAVVFGAVLAMIFVATVWTEWWPPSFRLSAAGLVISLLGVYLVPIQPLLEHGTGVRLAYSSLVGAGPILFASVCFARRFSDHPAADRAYGWNLVGAVGGGLAEFLSMEVGLRALLLLALAAYLISFALRRQDRRAHSAPTLAEGYDRQSAGPPSRR